MAEQGGDGGYDEVTKFFSGVVKQGDQGSKDTEVSAADREAWMVSMRETNTDWAAIVGSVWTKFTASGLPDCVAAQLVRDDNWIFQCWLMDYSETPIPPGACEHEG